MGEVLQKNFVFAFSNQGTKSTLKVPIPIPLDTTAESLAGRLIAAHNIPCYVEADLLKKLKEFLAEETEKWQDEFAEAAVKKLRSGSVSVEELARQWTKAYTKEIKQYSPPEETSDEVIFSEVYHALIHSDALETLFNLEHQYSIAVEEIIGSRNWELETTEKKHGKEMEQALQDVRLHTDEHVNILAQKHFEKSQELEVKWNKELKELQNQQKREYREWVMKVYEDSSKRLEGTPAYVQKVRALSRSSSDRSSLTQTDVGPMPPEPRLEESFTVHLGAQLKTMHNLRLLCADVLDLCRHRISNLGGLIVPQPQRLQTAMSLYSNNLCGLILLVDNRLNFYTGIKRDFARICENSTDFHFPDLESQFQHVEESVIEANKWRAERKLNEDGDRISVKSSSSGSSETQGEEKLKRMQNGDFYITKHSNLSEVHVVFHLVSDDSVKNGDISSRHPLILAIRNVLKVCSRNDVTTLTIPLLLAHEMSEEMTIPWCMKRAELVFKCVKGFMMEMATWGDSGSKTIQFLVPKELSEDMFHAFSNMLPQIFRVNNPLVIKSS
ncbi:protein C12orf4 homolog [Lingula anatina]|uniref:Protein C12orf4 homolog n=1 Tax=Lingula anatina TaxID=7574 RepID=A0A1S3K0H4_LINAN|nr:protein C12orf4 homolog [Lingula anatina]XP_013416135.1 protein C12orf4 homolog [Lingula anatina]|eukprot:XP_013416133.1 protein C12orf4 homolog [Lingula anatina]